MNEKEKLYYIETEKSLKSQDKKIVRARIKELKSTGNARLLRLVLDLLNSDPDEEIKQDILGLLSDLRSQDCAEIVTEFISANPNSNSISEIIASCWQSRIDFSAHLDTFANIFISGNYISAVESFTVIEEAIWKSSEVAINDCIKLLNDRSAEIIPEKKALYDELIKVLESGRTQNSEDFPDLYSE